MRRVLWGRNNSSNVMKVIWLLEELHLPYERRDAGGAFGKTERPEYRAMNPTGLVPTLEEDGFTLWESNAILRYLAGGASGGSAYYPADPHTRARIDQWLDAQQNQLNRPIGTVFWGMVRTPPEQRDMGAIRQAIAHAAGIWRYLDSPLSAHPFLSGGAFGIADIAWGVHVHRWYAMAIERPDNPLLRAWYERLLERPAYTAHVARPLS
ncbi:MAG: glutathione S-transferase family protein [Alphaproteobacteria bacterium]|nr:glutathione S-transferase family protein [Alphaproteobacteria bacterium]